MLEFQNIYDFCSLIPALLPLPVTTLCGQNLANIMIESNYSPAYTNMRSQFSRRRPFGCWFVGIATVLALLFLLTNFYGPKRFSSSSHSLFDKEKTSSSLENDINNKTLGVRITRPSDGLLLTHSRSQFQQILVVNMPERIYQRDSMILAAALSGISVDFVDGVRGEAVTGREIPPDSDPRKFLPDGAIGCWRGHVNALKELVVVINGNQ